MPGYLPKDGFFPLIMPRIKVKDGFFEIPFPARLEGKELKEVRILPKYKARFFEVEYIIEAEPEPQPVDPNDQIAIDLGLNNLATCVSTTGVSFIVDGKPLKSINQWFNKENARVQSIKDLQGIKGITERQSRLTLNRNNRVRDYLNKTARYIINWCIEHKVGTVIVGVNQGWKQEINIGSRNNQNFVQIPHWSLRNKLKALCERYGLNYLEQEESYTSKASFLDKDDIPTYNPDNPQEYKFSGRRVKRGLYRSCGGHLVSADANGAANIGRKCSLNGFNSERVAAVLAQPLRVKIS
nr:transposase [Chroococcidiopsis cubana]